MKNFVFLFMISFVLLACNDSTKNEYCNQRFGYCIVYPSIFQAKGESQNSDGKVLYAEQGNVELLIWGSVNGFSRTLAEEKAFASKEKEVAYQVLKEHFYVISGLENNKIFYRRTEKTPYGFRSFEIRYPKTEKERYNKLVNQIVFKKKKAIKN